MKKTGLRPNYFQELGSVMPETRGGAFEEPRISQDIIEKFGIKDPAQELSRRCPNHSIVSGP